LKNELDRIPEAIANSNNYYRMQTLNQGLEKLTLAKIITVEEALRASHAPDDLKLRLAGMVREEGY
jgi:Tfp pilus assembly ATPase PilU